MSRLNERLCQCLPERLNPRSFYEPVMDTDERVQAVAHVLDSPCQGLNVPVKQCEPERHTSCCCCCCYQFHPPIV